MQRFCLTYSVLKVVLQKSQFPHKFVNSLFILVIIKDKLTDLYGSLLLRNDFINTFLEISAAPVGRVLLGRQRRGLVKPRRCELPEAFTVNGLQGNLAQKKTPSPLGPP